MTDRLLFSEILQAVIEAHDARQYQVLAALYSSMITARDLLRELERLSAQARERSERHVENGVFNFMQVWVLGGCLEEPLLSEMRRFPDDRIKELIVSSPSSAPSPFSSTTRRCKWITRLRQPKKVLDNITSMGNQQIV